MNIKLERSVRPVNLEIWNRFSRGFGFANRVHQSARPQDLPFSGQTFVHIVGVIEMIMGVAILTKWTRVGAYVALAGLVRIGKFPSSHLKSSEPKRP